MHSAQDSLGNYLANLRTKKGYSIRQLALRAQVSPRAICYWEGGEHQPRRWELQQLLNVLADSEPYQNRAWELWNPGAPHKRIRSQDSMNVHSRFGLPPRHGDLLRALRMRRRIPKVQLAVTLGIHTTTLARWESSRTMPSAAMIDRLCDSLNALPEERAALLNNTLYAISDRPQTWEELEARTDSLWPRVCAGDSLSELYGMATEAELWQLLKKSDRAESLYARARIYRAAWLSRHGRHAEAAKCAEHALTIAQLHGKPDKSWLYAISAMAAHRRNSPAPGACDRAVELHLEWKNLFSLPEELAYFYCSLADNMSVAGRHEAALDAINSGLAAAEQTGSPQDPIVHIIKGAVLLNADRAGEALESLHRGSCDDVFARATRAVNYADAFLRVGNSQESQAWLERTLDLLATDDFPRIRQKAETLAELF